MVLLVKKVWNLGQCVRNVTRLRWLAVVLLCHSPLALAELARAIGLKGFRAMTLRGYFLRSKSGSRNTYCALGTAIRNNRSASSIPRAIS